MNGKILSYSAGSTSLDPYKFRVIDSGQPAEKMQRLVSTFPSLQPFFVDPSQSLVVDAYPASLGGMESMTRVITYLHPPTCTRALRLAAAENRRVVFVAQPLAGADLLIQALRTQMDWPSELLWATGGYPLPASLQRSVDGWLAERGCRLSVLQAYGVAELDHTLMASMHRDQESRPIYQLVDPRLELDAAQNRFGGDSGASDQVRFRGEKRKNHDRIESFGTGYHIHGNPSLYGEGALQWLEQWQPEDWMNHTGFWRECGRAIELQQRSGRSSSAPVSVNSLSWSAMTSLPTGVRCQPVEHYEFMSRSGMSWMEKPKWNAAAFTQPGEQANVSLAAAAA
ncbi:hypothetical protein [Rhodopirellula sp. P2]|uniref:hypothetical protein n=1 Tax=Rhodopirellula sp. P2 TaxID=2127060 RepID=UPI002368CB65|nr:hypothetical protein [Rhodopirellula sp. P2]WDQ18261.1 hypothetical protein PSR62_06855 [Rhodopirellula sp. P2]